MTTAETKLSDLFDALVPINGKAPTVAGEIVRAINRIAYRNWNDGDHVGVGYGRETCNPAARFLEAKVGGKVGNILGSMWGLVDDDRYDSFLHDLEVEVLAYLDDHPDAKTTPNTENMWDYRVPDEDEDTYDEDEEVW